MAGAPAAPAVCPSPGMVVVVTRPEKDAQLWVTVLAQAGHRPLALPLMAFGPPPDPAAMAECLAHLHTFSALVFVSPQAAHAFWGQFIENKGPLAIDGIDCIAAFFADLKVANGRIPRCWAPGPGTARALQALGVPAHCIDQPAPDASQFDSEALWAVVEPSVNPGDRVLLVRGHTPDLSGPTGSGRDWLGEQCVARGATVSHCVAYSRAAPSWGAAERRQALAASGPGCVWLLTSSESVGHLGHLLPGHDWSGTWALATHPRIASTAQALGFGRVLHCRPDVGDVLDTLTRAACEPAVASAPPKMASSP